jgi:transposase
MDEHSLKVLLARGLSVEEIGRRFQRDASTVAYWMRKYGLEAPTRAKYAPKGGIDQGQLEVLVGEGRSIAQIAETVGLSKATVRHWLGKYGLRTRNRVGPHPHPAATAAREAGLLNLDLSCPTHGDTEFTIDTRGCYRCRKCRVDAVNRRRRHVKTVLVAEAGGRCALCGYDRCAAALAFHHLDPRQKRMNISAQGMGVGIDTLRAEASKCLLLCHNCHAEVESGATELPIK